MLDRLLAATTVPATTLRAWWTATATTRATVPRTIERALLGGALADRLGFAFAAGYAEALRFLVPSDADDDTIAALCATEDAGNHPRAIRTSLTATGDGHYILAGRKRWATAAGEAASLVVIASIGDDPTTGRNRLRAVRVPVASPGVRLHPSTAPFVPEIPHAEVELVDVHVPVSAILPGDGYDDYLKPFRTIEDLHVHAALVGYLVGVVRRHGLPLHLLDALLALAASTLALAALDQRSPATHLALAGLLALATTLVDELERAWPTTTTTTTATPLDDERERWQRDRALLQVASKARASRLAAARTAVGIH